MKKFILSIIVFLSLLSCDDSDSGINGMWQLKSVTNAYGETNKVDSIFYSFQEKAIFTFTVLKNENAANIVYGYSKFLSDDKLSIWINENNLSEEFLKLSGWADYEETFIIDKFDSKSLILTSEANKKKYILKKY